LDIVCKLGIDNNVKAAVSFNAGGWFELLYEMMSRRLVPTRPKFVPLYTYRSFQEE
jgi:hypothetical protein